jgi:hypothetical protein
MWRRVRNGNLAEVLPQANNVQPTSGQAVELASTHDVRRNVLRHLRQEIESSPDDRTFGAQIAEIPDSPSNTSGTKSTRIGSNCRTDRCEITRGEQDGWSAPRIAPTDNESVQSASRADSITRSESSNRSLISLNVHSWHGLTLPFDNV